MSEAAFLSLLRGIATSPAALGLQDDCALLEVGGARLVITQDSIVESIHFLPDDPPDSIGWKLAAVNLSDLAAKGARPLGCLMSYALSGDEGWDAAFLTGLDSALTRYAMPLMGGDTVRMPASAPRSFTLTAIGEAQPGAVPTRSSAREGDGLYITGPVGDAGFALKARLEGQSLGEGFLDRYRRPVPRLSDGQALAPHAHAMMDVSDGLLIDAQRMADASDLGILIDAIPLSDELKKWRSDAIQTRLAAATMGDDYELLIALPGTPPPDVPLFRVGRFTAARGLHLMLDGRHVPVPERLGYTHD